jgi:hypothetical protein
LLRKPFKLYELNIKFCVCLFKTNTKFYI